jgi:hypothetical protein
VAHTGQHHQLRAFAMMTTQIATVRFRSSLFDAGLYRGRRLVARGRHRSGGDQIGNVFLIARVIAGE